MLRIWGKMMDGSRMIRDAVKMSDDVQRNLTQRLMDCMEELCREFDLEKPIWLDSNYDELNRYGRTSFRQDHFIEQIAFTSLEIEIIEMDDD